MLGTFTGVMVAVVSAREAGWLKRFRASPMPPGSYLAGQIIFNVVDIACARRGNDGHRGLGLRSASSSYLTLRRLLLHAARRVLLHRDRLAITRVITTPEMGSSVGPFVTITLSFTSGVFLPPDLMPHWLVSVSNYLPLEPLAQSMQARSRSSPAADSNCARSSCSGFGGW